MKYTIKIKQSKDGFIEVRVKGYGKTWAKDLDDVGVAVNELVQTIDYREANFKTLFVSNKE